jgi:hypothetical protein
LSAVVNLPEFNALYGCWFVQRHVIQQKWRNRLISHLFSGPRPKPRLLDQLGCGNSHAQLPLENGDGRAIHPFARRASPAEPGGA